MPSVNFFCAGTKVFEEALNAVKFLDWLKKFGSTENILRPVKGQGNRLFFGQEFLKTTKVILPTFNMLSQGADHGILVGKAADFYNC